MRERLVLVARRGQETALLLVKQAHPICYLGGALADPRCTLLFGNHDLPYAWPENLFIERPGFSEEKALAVGSVLSAGHWAQLALCARVGPWLVSHAGFTRGLVPEETLADPEALAERCRRALSRAANGEIDPLLLAGRDRGGRQPAGGVTWGDFRRFQSSEGIHQLVGHTPDPCEPLRAAEGRNSLNFCLDHHNGRVFAVVGEEGTAFKLWSRRRCPDPAHRGAFRT